MIATNALAYCSAMLIKRFVLDAPGAIKLQETKGHKLFAFSGNYSDHYKHNLIERVGER